MHSIVPVSFFFCSRRFLFVASNSKEPPLFYCRVLFFCVKSVIFQGFLCSFEPVRVNRSQNGDLNAKCQVRFEILGGKPITHRTRRRILFHVGQKTPPADAASFFYLVHTFGRRRMVDFPGCEVRLNSLDRNRLASVEHGKVYSNPFFLHQTVAPMCICPCNTGRISLDKREEPPEVG